MKNISVLLTVLLFITLSSISSSCGDSNEDPFAKCRYGKPQAVFSSEVTQVQQHQFKVQGLEGIEEVKFANGMDLELIQSGCNEIKQTFNFRIPAQLEAQEEGFWIGMASEQLRYLSSLDPNYTDLQLWAQAIEAVASQLRLGEKMEVQPSFFVKINKVKSSDYSLVTVEFSQETVENKG